MQAGRLHEVVQTQYFGLIISLHFVELELQCLMRGMMNNCQYIITCLGNPCTASMFQCRRIVPLLFVLFWRLTLPLTLFLILLLPVSPSHAHQLPPSMFVFGASMVDSGTHAVVMPYRSCADFDPYGSDYFGKPVGKWSNGRTFMDIITQSLGLGLLDPFVKSVGANFTHGVNFASAGSTAQNSSEGLFSLLVQVDQFNEYQNFILSEEQGGRVPKVSRMNQSLLFQDSIFFMETANNDYLYASGLDSDLVKIIESVIASMRRALERLYELGGRTFIVMNVTPLGCSPSVLSLTLPNSTRDKYNCSKTLNDFVSLHNWHLDHLLDELRSKYSNADWILFDAYSIFLDGYRNPSTYGLTDPFRACCGAGGLYNWRSDLQCGEAGKYIDGVFTQVTKCEDPRLHLIWDSIHPTESFGQHIAQGVLHGTHLIPTFNITHRLFPTTSNVPVHSEY